MPLLLNDNPNPQAVMLGKQHLRKLMLGGDVVWQRHRSKPPSGGDVSLESLAHRGVKLTARNQDGNLFFPMHFPPLKTDDWKSYLDRLTFLGDTVLSLQSIDAMLEADVVGLDMLFPMFFFDDPEPRGRIPQGFDFHDKLTFIANIPMQLGLESIDGLLVAEIRNDRNMYFPMVFPDLRPQNRSDFLDKLTFIEKLQ